MKLRSLLVTLALLMSISSFAAVTIDKVGGWFESGYVTFGLVDGASTYAVYYKTTSGSDYLKLDSELVRNYGTYGRADVLGITAGTYQFKVVPVDGNGNEMVEQAAESASFEVKAHDRAGFAHLNYQGVGAYQDNGQLKSGAKVLYVTGKTAKTVKCTIKGVSYTGLQAILDAYEDKNLMDATPLAIRILGIIEAGDMDSFKSSGQGIKVKGPSAVSKMNLTIEGVGNDAAFRGFGINFSNCESLELRNFAVMNCMEDAIGLEGPNRHMWIHNMDIFYGQNKGGDKAKGDGSLDLKDNSQYLTLSYNHFWDCGKCSLCGMKSESGPNYISYHHNWFDHSDSRHPRVRTMTVHVYNNYFDGIAKYGVGVTTGSSVFVEANYYRNINRPMMSSKQGTDALGEGTFSGENGGMIKSFGNKFIKGNSFSYITYQTNATSFDAYEATSRDEKVPSSVKTLAGGTTYNNFDTDPSLMYTYTPHTADQIPDVVTGQYGAGRMQHGDFQWSFTNSADDASYAINSALASAMLSHKSSLVGIFGSTGGGDNSDPDPEPEPNPNPNPNSGYACWFLADNAWSNSFYTINGNTSNSKGTATVGDVTYEYCLKMESSTKVKFTTTEDMTLTLVFASSETPSIKIDGEEKSASSGNIYTCELTAGTHELSKANTRNLFYINLTGAAALTPSYNVEAEDGPIYDLSGRVVKNPQRGIYIQNGKKIVIQ